MIALTPLACAIALLGVAVIVDRSPRAIEARDLAVSASRVVLAGAFWATVFATYFGRTGPIVETLPLRILPPGGLTLVPLVFCMVGFAIVSLAPVVSHPPRTLARILILIAAALGCTATDNALVIVTLWVVSAWVAWTELSSTDRDSRTARLFAVYHSVSGICLVAGALFLEIGQAEIGVPLLLVGIAVREAVVPLHSWFPSFVAAAPLGVVVALAAPQLGLYAHLYFISDRLPEGLAQLVAVVGTFSVIVSAALGLVQTEVRRALAFLIISQTGLVAFGLDSGSPIALAGSLVTGQVLALAMAGFTMTLAALEARRGRLSVSATAGSFSRAPRMAGAVLVLGLASVGFPLTLGFVAEDLLVQGSVGDFPALSLALIFATALNGVTVMRCFFYLFSGVSGHNGEIDLRRREINALTVIMVTLLIAGTAPRTVVSLMQSQGTTPKHHSTQTDQYTVHQTTKARASAGRQAHSVRSVEWQR